MSRIGAGLKMILISKLETEADHFGNCPVCGALVDMRNLGQLMAHMHDAAIEIIDDLELAGGRPGPLIWRLP
jgi:hypothetical protein